MVNGFLETYCSNYYISNNKEVVDHIREHCIKYLNNPPNYLKDKDSFKEILKLTWNLDESEGGFDKMLDNENGEAIESLDQFVFLQMS
jgi:hypothetical protein